MPKETLLQCVDCGYMSKTFNVVVAGIDQGAFTYAAQCPICAGRKVKTISIARTGEEEPGLEILIQKDNQVQIIPRKAKIFNVLWQHKLSSWHSN